MSLLETFDRLFQDWRSVLPQERTFERAYRLGLGLLTAHAPHLTSTALCTLGRQFRDWSAEYRVFSRSPWQPRQLFTPVFNHLPELLPASLSAPVLAALDDTLCKKTGRHIPGVTTARDPRSLPFHVNLCRGLRFFQVSLLVAPQNSPGPARALPVRFQPAPPVTKPKKDAPPEAWQAYRQQKKTHSLPQVGAALLLDLRQTLDQQPATQARRLLVSGDGSYTNSRVLRQLPPRTTFIGRIRKDAKLCLPLPPALPAQPRGRRKSYGPPAPTPQQVLHDDSIPWQKIPCFAARQVRDIPVKLLRPLFWRKSGPQLALQLVVIKPLGYRLRQGAKLLYREPAFLICTEPELDLPTLVQAYVYRWEIECNHRDEKSGVGVAQGQVRNPQAVARLPQFQVAIYSLLLLSSILAYGFQRAAEYLPLPKWRRRSIRPSLLDLLNLLRQQITARALPAEPQIISTTSFLPFHQPRSRRNYPPYQGLLYRRCLTALPFSLLTARMANVQSRALARHWSFYIFTRRRRG